jgi:integrase/recombinase XerD
MSNVVDGDLVPINRQSLTQSEYQRLADVPPELEWLANITNVKTRRAYKVDVSEFILFNGLKDHSALRTVARAHVIAWRKDMESPDEYSPQALGAIITVRLSL